MPNHTHQHNHEPTDADLVPYESDAASEAFDHGNLGEALLDEQQHEALLLDEDWAFELKFDKSNNDWSRDDNPDDLLTARLDLLTY